MITLLEHRASLTTTEERASKGWSRQALAPRIMRDRAPYDPHLDRFFADLPLNGVRSRHSLRSYAYQAYERAAKRSDVKFITVEDYRRFRDVGILGLDVDGNDRPGARDRNGSRNALFADLLITTGSVLRKPRPCSRSRSRMRFAPARTATSRLHSACPLD